MKQVVYVFIFISLSLIARPAHAAILYLTPDSGEYNLGDIFVAEIRLDTQGEYINAVEVNIVYPSDTFTVRDFSKGNSVLTLWAEEPSYGDGALSFIGGVPAGYQSWDGVLGRIIFRVKASTQQDIAQTIAANIADVKFLENSRALLNDGAGTEASLKIKNAAYTILSEETTEIEDVWQQEIAMDTTAPEAFIAEIRKDLNVYNGEYFIIFSTVDKQTGIDHYEVLESWEGGTVENKDAHSPYLLENQELSGIIRVRAVDKAGNEAIYEIGPARVGEKKAFALTRVIFGILVLVGAGVGYWVYRKNF